MECSDIVALGAAVTLFLTVLDPFAQQLVVYPVRTVNVDDESVFVPRATLFQEPAGDFGTLLHMLFFICYSS